MKKMLIVLSFIMTVLLVFSSCGAIDSDLEEKEFIISGFSIKLDESYSQISSPYTAMWISSETEVTALKESFELFENSSSLSALEYAELVAENNSKNSSVVEDDGLVFFEYKQTDLGEERSYFVCCYKGEKAFWTVQFICSSSNYEIMKDKFVNYAKTVAVS